MTSSISSFTDAGYTAVQTVNFNGTDYDFAKFSGTSMSSPAVTGIVALMLDANPNLSAAQVKQIIKTTARLDNNTGTITAPGHTRWGMGKIHAWRAVLEALNTTNISEITEESLLIFPNPATNEIQLILPDNFIMTRVQILSMDGKMFEVDAKETLDISELAPGTYVVQISNGNTWIHSKLIVL